MKKKIVALLASVLCVATLFTACDDGKSKFSRYVQDPYKEAPVLAVASPTMLFGAESRATCKASKDGKWIIFTDQNAKLGELSEVVYSVASGQIVDSVYKPTSYELSYTSSYFSIIEFMDGTSSYQKLSRHYSGGQQNKITSYHRTVYDTTGTQIASLSDEDAYPTLKKLGRNLVIGENLYKYSKNGYYRDTAYNEFTDLPNISVETTKYLYSVSDSGWHVYSQSLEKQGYFQTPSTDEDGKVHILANGNLLFQGKNLVPDSDSDYDYIEKIDDKAIKYDLITRLYDVDDNKVKEVDTDYIIQDYVLNKTNSDVVSDQFGSLKAYAKELFSALTLYGKRVDNIVPVTKIDNKRADTQDLHHTKLCSVENDGKIKDDMPQVVDNQFFISSTDRFGLTYAMEDRYFVFEYPETFSMDQNTITNTKVHIIDGDGNTIGTTNNTIWSNSKMFITQNGKCYDRNLNKIHDFSDEKGISVYGISSNALFLRREIEKRVTVGGYSYTVDDYEYEILTGGSRSTVASSHSNTRLYCVGNNFYIVKNESGSCTLYNDSSVAVMSTDSHLQIAYQAKDGSYAVVYTNTNVYVVRPN